MRFTAVMRKQEYSDNKASLKEIWGAFRYKYLGGGETPKGFRCAWGTDHAKLEAVFEDGKARFTYEGPDVEGEAIRTALEGCGATIQEADVVNGAHGTKDEERLMRQAKEWVDSWWTPVPQRPGEPRVFYEHRRRLDEEQYKVEIDDAARRLRDGVVPAASNPAEVQPKNEGSGNTDGNKEP